VAELQTQEGQPSLPHFAAGHGSSAADLGRKPGWVQYSLLVLVPVAVVVAVVLVLQMSGALAATGGCGGG
jgi:hypothetical protein